MASRCQKVVDASKDMALKAYPGFICTVHRSWIDVPVGAHKTEHDGQ